MRFCIRLKCFGVATLLLFYSNWADANEDSELLRDLSRAYVDEIPAILENKFGWEVGESWNGKGHPELDAFIERIGYKELVLSLPNRNFVILMSRASMETRDLMIERWENSHRSKSVGAALVFSEIVRSARMVERSEMVPPPKESTAFGKAGLLTGTSAGVLWGIHHIFQTGDFSLLMFLPAPAVLGFFAGGALGFTLDELRTKGFHKRLSAEGIARIERLTELVRIHRLQPEILKVAKETAGVGSRPRKLTRTAYEYGGFVSIGCSGLF